jgi:hypothetical protein
VIDHPDGAIEVGYWFGVDYQGKGYASEALRGTLDQIAADPYGACVRVFVALKSRRDGVGCSAAITGFLLPGDG